MLWFSFYSYNIKNEVYRDTYGQQHYRQITKGKHQRNREKHKIKNVNTTFSKLLACVLRVFQNMHDLLDSNYKLSSIFYLLNESFSTNRKMLYVNVSILSRASMPKIKTLS